MTSPAKVFAAALYAAGAALTIILAVLAALRAPYVPFPHAMLPATLGELAVGWLALGTLPMLLATVWLEHSWPALRSRPSRRWLCRLPALVCAACLLANAAVWGLGLLGVLTHAH